MNAKRQATGVRQCGAVRYAVTRPIELDCPQAITPGAPFGTEALSPGFAVLSAQPVTRAERAIPAGKLEKLNSRQNPGRDEPPLGA